jgi:hypothetical protein
MKEETMKLLIGGSPSTSQIKIRTDIDPNKVQERMIKTAQTAVKGYHSSNRRSFAHM